MPPVEARLGRPAAAGHRVRPDGFDLRWRQIGVLDTMADPQLPYFVHWQVDVAHHPSAGAGEVRIGELEIAGSPERIRRGSVSRPATRSTTWRCGGSTGVSWPGGLAAVTFATAHGAVRID